MNGIISLEYRIDDALHAARKPVGAALARFLRRAHGPRGCRVRGGPEGSFRRPRDGQRDTLNERARCDVMLGLLTS